MRGRVFCEPDDWTRRWPELASDLLIASWEEVLVNAHQGRLESCCQEFVPTMGFQGARVLARKSYYVTSC
jgi:hypothetical protein